MKTCTTCAAEYSKAQWKALPLVGHQVVPPFEDDLGLVIELKNCPKCNSTLAKEELFTGADVEFGVQVELGRGVGMKRAQQLAIENLKSDPRFYA